MAIIDTVFVSALTKNTADAGSDDKLGLSINIDGRDVANSVFRLSFNGEWQDRGQAGLYSIQFSSSSLTFDSIDLTNSSVRLAISGDDTWAPQDVLIFGRTNGRAIALAMEMGIDWRLSIDRFEGLLSSPIRLVSPGTDSTMIRRVVVLVYTPRGGHAGTDSPIELEITARQSIVLAQRIPDTPQADLEEFRVNWYVFDAAIPFNRRDVVATGGVRLRILGADKFTPAQFFVFGLDTQSGRPNEVVELVSLFSWSLGSLSADPSEGNSSVWLPLT